MRKLGLLCLFASASLADRLVEVSSTQFVGSQVDLAAIAVGNDGYLPSILSQRVQGTGHWRSVSLGLANVDQGKLDGPAVAMDRHGGGIVYVWLEGGAFRALGLVYEGRRTRSTDFGSVAVGGMVNPRVLAIASLRDGPLLVIAHDEGLTLVAMEPHGRGHADLIPTRGDAVAATEPFVAGRDGRTSIIVVAPGRLLQLVQAGITFSLGAETALGPDGFIPHAVAAEGRELWVGGERGGHAMLLHLEIGNPGAPGVPLDLGTGVVDHLRFLGPRELAAAGTKDGRAWVGVVTFGPRPGLAHEAYLKGTGVTALGTNPARKGWSLGVATPDGTVALLRVPGDPELPRDWDPFSVAPPPEPPPVPVPVPGPAAQPAEELPPVEAAGGRHRSLAVLPRAQAARGGTVDTEILLVNLGEQRAEVFLRFIPDGGRASFTRVTIEPGQRTKVSLAKSLFRRLVGDFDGYVRIDGGDRDTLVVDAVIRRQGEPPEEVSPHWR